jgi:uncharacterized membrane protein YgcG
VGAAEVELVLVVKLELVVVVGGMVDEMDWDVGEGTVYIVVVATMLTFTGGGGGPPKGGGGAPGGGGGRPPGPPPGGGGGSCPSRIAVNGGGSTPTKEHSPANQLEVA